MAQAMSSHELARRIASIATLKGEFTLRSGQVAHHYFDKYRFEGQPGLLRPLASEMAKHLPADTEIIAGLELGGVPLATAISLETGRRRLSSESKPRPTEPAARSKDKTSMAKRSPSSRM